MLTFLAVLVYLVAIGFPVYLIYRFHSQHWIWHVLSVAGAIGLGLVPIPPQLLQPGYDLLIGAVFVMLMTWGAGGLIMYSKRHHEKHA